MKKCFQKTAKVLLIIIMKKTKDNQIYAVEEDGEIQAMLHLNPYELAVNGSKKM